MQLQLEIPAGWQRSTAGTRRIAVVPGHTGTPDVLLAWSPLIILPDEQRAWVMSELRTDTPAAAQIQVVSDTTGKTRTGWPMRIVEATVHATQGGPATEWRTVAFYAFFEHAGTAMVRATVGSSRVDLQACKLEYSIVSPK